MLVMLVLLVLVLVYDNRYSAFVARRVDCAPV